MKFIVVTLCCLCIGNIPSKEFSYEKKDLPIKEMLLAYLAISKVVHWFNIIAVAEGIDGVWAAVLERLIQRDIVIILFLISVYAFEYMFIMKRKKWSGNLAQIILISIGYVMSVLILFAYALMLTLILQDLFNLREFIGVFFGGDLLTFSISYFVIAGFILGKESFKKKEACAYILDIQSKDIKLEMLKALLDGGVLSQEAFEKQKAKLMEV